eukprot:jgi/Undpi1/7633/HiC_scaffold_23.g10106.m1
MSLTLPLISLFVFVFVFVFFCFCSDTDVKVDLVPCILASEVIADAVATVASEYVMTNFFKGFWTAQQRIMEPPEAVLVLEDAADANHGLCSVIFVGIIPTPEQKTQLQDYSRKFQVRLVYFYTAGTMADTEVQTRLGMQQNSEEPSVGAPRVKLTAEAGIAEDSIVSATMMTDATTLSFFNLPVVQTAVADGVTIVADYADETGVTIPGTLGPNAAIAQYIGADGLEELHVFIALAPLDMGSWAWAHYIADWGTKGVFQGERRFHLAAVVDDLFLATAVFEYQSLEVQTGPEERLTGVDLAKFAEEEAALNTEYGSRIKTEHAFNGIGILHKVLSPFESVLGPDSGVALLDKGVKPTPPEAFSPPAGTRGMREDYEEGLWAGDDLLEWVTSNLDKFYWQSHTLTHIIRDNLGAADCAIEDSGNAQMAVLIGFFADDNYNWRSMTSPGISGLFNEHCLGSGAANLMMCYPGDNTYDGVIQTVKLVADNPYHSLTTTVETNGMDGIQIVPRWATNIYFNCATVECLINENEKVRRDLCGCAELNPALASGECPLCPDGIESFNTLTADDPTMGPLEKMYQTEEATNTRYILSGRRDKNMFHQANLISVVWPTEGPMLVDPYPEDSPSMLMYWYRRMIASIAKYINIAAYPVTTLKFDDLCFNFYEHQYLDESDTTLTVSKNAEGLITGMTMVNNVVNGAPIPFTVPTANAEQVLAALDPTAIVETEVYGADTTYYFSAGPRNAPPSKPAPE